LAGTNNGAFSTGYDLWYLKLSAVDKSVLNFSSNSNKVSYYYDKDLDGLGNSGDWQPSTGYATQMMPGYVGNNSDTNDKFPDNSLAAPQNVIIPE